MLVLGANGPTGRQTVRQALDRGYQVNALTRHPETFTVDHERLQVIAGDATDAAVVEDAVSRADAVIGALGTSFTRRRVSVYSRSSHLLVEAMSRTGVRRLVVVTSAGLTPADPSTGTADRLFRSAMRASVGKTVYDDMERMESVVSASRLAWTIVRPPGLTDEPGRGYVVSHEPVDHPLCAREDLAAALLDQLDDDRFVQKVAAVATPGLRVGALHMLRREVLKR